MSPRLMRTRDNLQDTLIDIVTVDDNILYKTIIENLGKFVGSKLRYA